MGKKEVRSKFRREVFERDHYTCKVCGKTWGLAEQAELNAHHITDRSLMPSGGYVVENGITVCEGECHLRCEAYHLTGDPTLLYTPDRLYRMIRSSYQLAFKASEKL